MKPEIKSIALEFPNCNDGTIIWYQVGEKGITKINSNIENGYLNIFYQIWKGENLYAELHHFSHIIYKEASK